MKDFFISYNRANRDWAEWIAWTLEEAGYSVVIEAWDFRPGGNFVQEMDRAAKEAERTIAVLSPTYLTSQFTAPEWEAAFAADPMGAARELIPVRVAPCDPKGLLAQIVYVDLVGLSESEARASILGALSTRAKPPVAPAFPGPGRPTSEHTTPAPVQFPGQPMPGAHADPSRSVRDLESQGHGQRPGPTLSGGFRERLELNRLMNAAPPQQFNMVLFAIDPPPGLVPPMPAPQGDRVSALLLWAEGPGGCGLATVKKVFRDVLGPQ